MPLGVATDAFLVEPEWLKVRRWRLTDEPARCRLVHCSDLHHKGDRAYLRKVIERIQSLHPELVCFTGDFVEQARYLPEVLEEFATLSAPVFAVPGNHDYWSQSDFGQIDAAMRRTGGRFLLDESVTALDGRVRLHGVDKQPARPEPEPGSCNVVLMHYPIYIERLPQRRFDLILAGHSHGGQVRLPWVGPLITPFNVGAYDLGLYQGDRGPMYVTSGLGWFAVRARLGCRPEIVEFTL